MCPLFDLQMSSKVEGLNVNWKSIYDLVYVFHGNIGHSTHHFCDISSYRLQRSKLDPSGLENDW